MLVLYLRTYSSLVIAGLCTGQTERPPRAANSRAADKSWNNFFLLFAKANHLKFIFTLFLVYNIFYLEYIKILIKPM